MYIEQTTSAERAIVSDITYPIIDDVARARRLIADLLSDYFDRPNKEPLHAEAIE